MACSSIGDILRLLHEDEVELLGEAVSQLSGLILTGGMTSEKLTSTPLDWRKIVSKSRFNAV